MRKYLAIALLVLGCADIPVDKSESLSEEKSLRGTECASGCIWSTYAVSSGVQKLTHYCDGLGCHCVEEGNIFNSCNFSSQNQVEEPDVLEPEPLPEISQSPYYNALKGQRIADEAYYEASRRGTVGWCYNAVADAVERITGRFLWGSHAYQAADQFASSPHFFEVWNRNLTTLPEGAIVVWAKGNSRSGHISVSLGNGQEASDHITSQMTYHYGGGSARIFLPK